MKKVGTMLLMLCMVSAVCACALFHQHTWNDPTCTEPKTCSACGEKEGEALGHAWTDATCTASKACSVCGATEGEAMGHAWTDATCTEPKTCSVCGVTEGVALGHTWTDATCTASKACSVCGATEGEALGHTWVEATCMEPKTCSVCGVTEGEALGHTWVDATCTEPKTCSVCGATEGDPLGHTEEIDPAAAPTCTESGFTEGAHCSICGAVLVPQKTVPALGHNWAAATFSDPKTCQVCCATEGEALGSQLFVNALNPDLSAESRGASLEALTGEEDAFVSTRKKIRITGSAKGIDSETEDIINNSSILLTIDQEEKTSARLKIEAVVNGSKPVNILFTVDEAGLGFTLPGIVEEYYKVEFETLLELLGGNASFQTIASSAQMAAGSMEKNRDLLLKYEKILFDVANGHNTTETVGEYALTGMGKVQNCRIIVCNPSANDWRKMLETILTTAQSDTELMDQIVGRSYSEQMQQYLGSWEAYEQMMRGMIEEWITSALENVPSMAKNLAGTTLEFAYEGMRLYGIRITTRFGDAIAYESFGDTQTGRTDALFLYEDEEPTLLAENRLERHSRRVTGRFSIPLAEVEVSYILGKTEEGKPVFDFLITVEETSVRLVLGEKDDSAVFTADYDDFNSTVSVQAVVTEESEMLIVPEGPAIVLKTGEEIQAALEKIPKDLFYKADYIAAMELYNNGKYTEAITAFEALNGYKDSKVMIEACQTAIKDIDYNAAMELFNDGKYREASSCFKALNDYKESATMYKEANYQHGLILFNDNLYAFAIRVFSELEDYRDSVDLMNEAKYLFVQANKSKTNTYTYQYLQELKEIDYKDSKEIFKDLFQWKAKLVAMNISPNDYSNIASSLSRTASYFHMRFMLEGGEPGQTVTLTHKVILPDGSVSLSSWAWEDVKALQSFGLECRNGLYENPEIGATGEMIVRIYVKGTDECIGEVSILITE